MKDTTVSALPLGTKRKIRDAALEALDALEGALGKQEVVEATKRELDKLELPEDLHFIFDRSSVEMYPATDERGTVRIDYTIRIFIGGRIYTDEVFDLVRVYASRTPTSTLEETE